MNQPQKPSNRWSWREIGMVTVLIVAVILTVWLFYREFNPALPYEYRDLSVQSPEFLEVVQQFDQLRSGGWENFRIRYVHPDCIDNPMLEYACKQLLDATSADVVSVDAFGKRILRVIIKVESGDNARYAAFLLSRGKNHLQWETPNL